MNTWNIPAKTFLLGEYAAINGEPAILLTTEPCFSVTLTQEPQTQGIHPLSPAGIWWSQHGSSTHHLKWQDPYFGIGGLGASSAQFIGAYLASCQLLRLKASGNVLIQAYLQSSWTGDGLKPSGYDLLAQSQSQCVYISHQRQVIESFHWPFNDIGFILVHSGQKLATHYHLRQATMPQSTAPLDQLVRQAKKACMENDSQTFTQSVEQYHQLLANYQLVAGHSIRILEEFKKNYPILAAKGCGAMGADVLLLIVKQTDIKQMKADLSQNGWQVLATHQSLYQENALFENNLEKNLEILP